MFLTPLINAGKIEEAQSKAYVHGSGIDSFVKSFSGYLAVNKDVCQSNLFFWFVPATVSTFLDKFLANFGTHLILDRRLSQ